jgi:hypothetical protein
MGILIAALASFAQKTGRALIGRFSGPGGSTGVF